MADSQADEDGLATATEKLKLDVSAATSAPIAEPDGQSEASCSNELVSQRSSSQKAPSVGSSSTTGPNITKVYYHIDDEASYLDFFRILYEVILV
jgi:hypothetical protein